MTRQQQTRIRARRGFTLIELLVVISILALLVSILLPGLQAARKQTQKIVCRSNMRQIVLAVLLYAQDYNDQVWPVNLDGGTGIPAVGGAWARILAPDNTIRPGFLYDYVQTVDKIGECPSNRRATNLTDQGENMFGGETALDFDYTMVANTQGARLDRRTKMGYLTTPEHYGNWALPPLTPAVGDKIRPISGLAIFVEEHTRFWNSGFTDGLWSNADQLEVRHGGGSNIAFLEGHVEAFEPPTGSRDKTMEPADLDANDFYVRARGLEWVRMERQSGLLRPYGWINNPEVELD